MKSLIDYSVFTKIGERICALGFDDEIQWQQNAAPPVDAAHFASEAVFVICNSGMKNTVARQIFQRVMAAIDAGESAATAFGHPGKAAAIDTIWRDRVALFNAYMAADDKLAACEALPWIGGITKYHLAKNFGAQVAKPDVHLQRIADWHGETVQGLCERLASVSGLKVATVDLILWRASAQGVIDTKAGRVNV